MRITKLHLKGFRCFSDQIVLFDKPITLIEGPNGSGKTSILEALHYSCYLRSFRTHTPSEIVHFDSKASTIKLEGFTLIDGQQESLALQIGFAGAKRKVKLNGKAIGSYKELLELYRVVTIIEEDVMLIKGAPELRRSFIDQALFLFDPAYAEILRKYKKVLKQRNALLACFSCDRESYDIWTEQLVELTAKIQTARIVLLKELEVSANGLIAEFFNKKDAHNGENRLEIALVYKPKTCDDRRFEKERLFKRSLFGAHLDDFSIFLGERASKHYASRGQQKLVAMVLKIAQLRLLKGPAIVLIDDFMTDFDQTRIKLFLRLLAAGEYQLIFTCPLSNSPLSQGLVDYSYQSIQLEGINLPFVANSNLKTL